MTALLLAIDVGTTSVRAGVFDTDGAPVATGIAGLNLLRPHYGQAVYRSAEIWSSVRAAIQRALEGDGGLGLRVVGLAFGATASLVLDHEGAPPLDGRADVFCWMDHRAEAEAMDIARTGDAWLDHMGGAVSPENHLPKLMWLKRHDPAGWQRVTAVRDLCDDLVLRATGDDRHSFSALASKWPYDSGRDDPWRHELLEQVDLTEIWAMGALSGDHVPVGQAQAGLLSGVAAEWGVPPGIPVSAGIIDAHAGLLGAIGRNMLQRVETSAVLVGGFSSGLMLLSREQRHIPGVWGPFRDAILPGFWLHEAGQSYSGAALDDVIALHPGGPRRVTAGAHAAVADEIQALLEREGAGFAAQRHIVPDWLGNRAPQHDGSLRALDTGIDDGRSHRAFLETYYATARALALQMRHIIAHIAAFDVRVERLCLAGGQSRNPLLVRLYRDATNVDVVVPAEADPVLLGIAMAAAAAAQVYPDLPAAVEVMAPPQARMAPDRRWRQAHGIAYDIYLKLFDYRTETARASAALSALGTSAMRQA